MKQRLSNIELLRLLAMMFVLVVHVNYGSLGWPQWKAVQSEPLLWTGRVLTEQVSIVCVNLFVLISGWFGLHPTLRGGLKLLFQVFFFAVIGLALFYLFHPAWMDTPGSAVEVFVFYWFVWAYLLLYLLSPVLNAYVERATPRQLQALLVVFYVLQTVNFIRPFIEDFHRGYSVVSFIGLYLLARYVRLYLWPRWQGRALWKPVFGVYVLTLLLPLLAFVLIVHYGSATLLGEFIPRSTDYSNPLIVLEALSLLLLFNCFEFHSSFINWLAASAFAVYLIHQNPLVRTLFYDTARDVHLSAALPLVLFRDVAFLCAVYFGSVLMDQLRVAAWNGLLKLVAVAERRVGKQNADTKFSHK